MGPGIGICLSCNIEYRSNIDAKDYKMKIFLVEDRFPLAHQAKAAMCIYGFYWFVITVEPLYKGLEGTS